MERAETLMEERTRSLDVEHYADVSADATLCTAAWSDGLPIVVPTAAKVDAMLVDRENEAEQEVGIVPPSFAPVSLREVAAAAVMAGCQPPHLGVVEVALRAALTPEFNLMGLQTTTEPSAVLLLVNGTARHTLPINCRSNVLGNSSSANAPIGRAVRLVLTRYGNAVPGITDMATFGHPGKLTYCIGEDEETSPWSAFHVERGFSPHDDVVTVIGADAPMNVPCPAGGADAILSMIALAMAAPTTNNVLFGGEVVVILSPEHTRALVAANLSKADIKNELFERARVGSRTLPASAWSVFRNLRDESALGHMLTAADSPASILLVVAGGIGSHSTVVPTFGFTRAVSAAF